MVINSLTMMLRYDTTEIHRYSSPAGERGSWKRFSHELIRRYYNPAIKK